MIFQIARYKRWGLSEVACDCCSPAQRPNRQKYKQSTRLAGQNRLTAVALIGILWRKRTWSKINCILSYRVKWSKVSRPYFSARAYWKAIARWRKRRASLLDYSAPPNYPSGATLSLLYTLDKYQLPDLPNLLTQPIKPPSWKSSIKKRNTSSYFAFRDEYHISECDSLKIGHPL